MPKMALPYLLNMYIPFMKHLKWAALCLLWAWAAGAQGQEAQRLASKLDSLYSLVKEARPQKGHRPLIGISLTVSKRTMSLGTNYTNAIMKAGGTPCIIPTTDNLEVLADIVKRLDGLLLTGGEDIDPAYYGAEPHEKLGTVNPLRDAYELKLFKLAHDRGMPIWGVCRGEQLINVAMGGTLYQDLPTEVGDSIQHRQTEHSGTECHWMRLEAGSTGHKVFGMDSIGVNTMHHQAVRQIAPGMRIIGTAPDGVVEMIESTVGSPVLGIQSHPEAFVAQGDEVRLNFFRLLVKKARAYHKASRKAAGKHKAQRRRQNQPSPIPYFPPAMHQ